MLITGQEVAYVTGVLRMLSVPYYVHHFVTKMFISPHIPSAHTLHGFAHLAC